MISQTQKDPAVPSWGFLLPPRVSPHNSARSYLGRLSTVPGRQQSPCPNTLPLRCTDPARKDSLGQPGLHIHLPNPAAVLGRRQLSWPVPLRVQKAVPALQHILTFYRRETVILLMVHPMVVPWSVPALRDLSTKYRHIALHTETYRVKG